MRCHPCWDGDHHCVPLSCWVHQEVALLPSPQGRPDAGVMAMARVETWGGLGLELIPAQHHGGDMGTVLKHGKLGQLPPKGVFFYHPLA